MCRRLDTKAVPPSRSLQCWRLPAVGWNCATFPHVSERDVGLPLRGPRAAQGLCASALPGSPDRCHDCMGSPLCKGRVPVAVCVSAAPAHSPMCGARSHRVSCAQHQRFPKVREGRMPPRQVQREMNWSRRKVPCAGDRSVVRAMSPGRSHAGA